MKRFRETKQVLVIKTLLLVVSSQQITRPVIDFWHRVQLFKLYNLSVVRCCSLSVYVEGIILTRWRMRLEINCKITASLLLQTWPRPMTYREISSVR